MDPFFRQKIRGSCRCLLQSIKKQTLAHSINNTLLFLGFVFNRHQANRQPIFHNLCHSFSLFFVFVLMHTPSCGHNYPFNFDNKRLPTWHINFEHLLLKMLYEKLYKFSSLYTNNCCTILLADFACTKDRGCIV